MASTDDLLRRMSREWAAGVVKRAQPVLATVSGTTDNGLLHVNIEGDGTGTGNVPEVATPNGSYDYQVGDRILVARSRSKALPHQVIGFYYNDNDSTYYPRQKTDYIKAPGGTLDVDATDITLNGDSIVPDGKVKVSSNDSTPGFLEDKVNANSGVASFTYNDGSNEQLGIFLDIDGLTADGSPDGANDYVPTHDASTGTVKKVLLNNLPGGGGAPTDATYIVQTANGTLTNEQALSALASGDVQVTTTTGVLTSLKANRSASAAPGTGDDSSAGYSVGSRWIDTTNDKEYVCLDASVGAAVWTETTGAGSGGGDVSGPVSSTDNAVVRWDGTGGDTVQDSGITIDDNDRLTLPDSSTYPPLSLTARSSAPSTPSSGDIYLDDGTNTDTTNVGLRRYNGSAWFNLGGYGREVLSATREYYVRTDGSDSNDGLTDSAGGALLTIQEAVDRVAGLDMRNYQVNINVGNGTYGPFVLRPYLGTDAPGIFGDNTTPSNVVIDGSGAVAINGPDVYGQYFISGFKVQSSGARGIQAKGHTKIQFEFIDFGACSIHMITEYGGVIEGLDGSAYSISGAAVFHMASTYSGSIAGTNMAVTFSTNPTNFSQAYALATSGGHIVVYGQSYTNKAYATGARYSATLNGTINTNGGGATFLPGNSAGSTATGGQYT